MGIRIRGKEETRVELGAAVCDFFLERRGVSFSLTKTEPECNFKISEFFQ